MTRTFTAGCVHFFVLCVISSIIGSVCELICPKIISFAIDCVIGGKEYPFYFGWFDRLSGGDTGVGLWMCAALVILFAGLMALFNYLQMVYNRKGSETLVENSRNRLFHHIERLPFSWHMNNQTGDIIQRCTSDVETMKNFLSEQLTSIISTVLLIVMSLVFMFSINVKLSLIALCSIPVILIYSIIFANKIGDGFRQCDENEGRLSSIAQENLTGVRVVRAFGREKYEVDKFAAQNKIYTDAWVKLSFLMSMFWSAGDVLTTIQSVISFIVGIVFCVDGSLSVGDFVAITSYNNMLMWPVRQLGRTISEMSKAGISFSRIGDIMSVEEERDEEGAVDCDAGGDIVFDNVSFAYEGKDGGSTEVLKNVSLTVKKGTTVGILGMTGSGKSTLVQLLCRLYELPEDCGKITVNGVDIRHIKAESLRHNIGIVLQEPFLFSRTLGENIGITYENPAEHEREIHESARVACLDETIESFKNGYNTMVGERGVTLSGGQKQRTAIARLLTQNTPVMIFDDSLSAVDSETDAKIRAALREKTSDATVIIISHRIQTLMYSDNIAVMSGGRIVEEGSHEELLKLGGIYKKINDIQSSDMTETDGTNERKEDGING